MMEDIIESFSLPDSLNGIVKCHPAAELPLTADNKDAG